MFRVIDALSLPGKSRNEDHYRFSENTLLLLDGSTGLSPNAPDAVWFVQGFADRFMKRIAQTDDLCLSVNASLEELFAEFNALNPDAAHDTVYPSAAALILHIRGEALQILNIGDCTAVLFGKETRTVHTNEVERFDNAVLEQMKAIQSQTGEDLSAIVKTEAIRSHLLANRRKMNASDGYEILSFNMKPREERHLLTLEKKAFHRIHLFTDGFEALHEELSQPDIPALKELYRRLRQEEQQDRTLNRRPRFKVSDDASALVAALS